jgi:dimethylamine--corrinoid protein Co-methyltransferase
MAFLHELATGMGGLRTAGDLVARIVMSKAMRINEAKAYVANKLGVSVLDLADSTAMREIREELDLGHVLARPGAAIGIEAKARIARLLDISIRSVEMSRRKAGWV